MVFFQRRMNWLAIHRIAPQEAVMATNTRIVTTALLRTTARIVTTALVGGGAVLASVSPAVAATPAHNGQDLTVLNAARAQSPATNTCKSGFVWRDAFPGDAVCVSPDERDQAHADNAAGPSRIAPGTNGYGSHACKPGYVWRVARPSDLVCVTPDTRDRVAADNRLAASRRATESAPANDGKVSVVYEVLGQGTADAVTIDDGPLETLHNVALPFRTTRRVPADIDLLQVHASGNHATGVGCRISLDGKFVVSSPTGDCVFHR
jgi:hypothetical protein